jgi:hypothetical protein
VRRRIAEQFADVFGLEWIEWGQRSDGEEPAVDLMEEGVEARQRWRGLVGVHLSRGEGRA